MLSGQYRPEEILTWLQDDYLPTLTNVINSDTYRRRLGLYSGEVLPSNERNLTDVRTRMGVLLEFELARAANELLESEGVNDLFWAYVVANRFPDLEIRSNSGERLLRLEVKCLQARAEEKSANFGTLIKDIDPNTDFLIVCLWEWDSTRSGSPKWDSAPLLLRIYAFHAYSLALLRDYRWLNTPPKSLRKGYQGYDVYTALTCRDGLYSKEQGNYGKLLRIWSSDLTYNGPKHSLIDRTAADYETFKDLINVAGFKVITSEHFEALELGIPEFSNTQNGVLRASTGGISYMYSPSKKDIKDELDKYDIAYVVSMSPKYRCSLYQKSGALVPGVSNVKPKSLVSLLESHVI